MSHNFALIGAAGFVAPRHMKAIQETGHRLVAAMDPHDAVGVLDRYDFGVRFFTEIERFDRHLEKLRRGPADGRVEYVSICSPNYLHDAHVRLALRLGATPICEKPLVINPWNIDALQELEREHERKICTVLQLRLHPALIELKAALESERASGSATAPGASSGPGPGSGSGSRPGSGSGSRPGSRKQVMLTYVTARGPWYAVSWKGSEERSGGLAANIGIHFFDLLMWLFGPATRCEVYQRESRRMAGYLELAHADVRWLLSIDSRDLATPPQPGGKTTHRSITVDGRELEFTEGFADLHTRVYEHVLAGRGFGTEEVRPSVELVHQIRTAPVTPRAESSHPLFPTGAGAGASSSSPAAT